MGRVTEITVNENNKSNVKIRKSKNIVKKIEGLPDIVIEKGIPLPNIHRQGLSDRFMEIFLTMDVGDSFFLADNEKNSLSTVIATITRYNKKFKIDGKSYQKLVRRKVDGGHRVWRFV